VTNGGEFRFVRIRLSGLVENLSAVLTCGFARLARSGTAVDPTDLIDG
jgi:hypothetical protein